MACRSVSDPAVMVLLVIGLLVSSAWWRAPPVGRTVGPARRGHPAARSRKKVEPMYLAAVAASCTEQGRPSPAGGDVTVSYSDAIVAQAKLWVGYREGPGNQNMFSAGLGLPPEAWCQDFVQFVSASAGYKQPHTTSAVVSIGDWARQNGLFIVSTKATPGCQILYDFSGGDGREPVNPAKTHTGIYIGAGQTIEGNSGTHPEGVHQNDVQLGAVDIWGA